MLQGPIIEYHEVCKKWDTHKIHKNANFHGPKIAKTFSNFCAIWTRTVHLGENIDL